MPDERISDASLQSIHDRWPHESDVCRIIRELQQWRAAAKYPRDHVPDCEYDVTINLSAGTVSENPCTCGYDDLPAWMRGGQ